MSARTTAAIREALLERDAWLCVRCGVPVRGRVWSPQHRRPAGSGGSSDPELSSLWNLLTLCGSPTTGCHGWVETHRADSYDTGWLVHSWQKPSEVPVLLHGELSWLTEGGTQWRAS